jgi:hypothetical protein
MTKTFGNHSTKSIDPSDRMRELMLKLKQSGSYRLLEPRMVFDGAAAETASQTFDGDAPPVDTATSQDAASSTTDALDIVAALASAPSALDTSANALIFIDARVTDLDVLADAVNQNGQIVFIDPSRDGVEQIAEVVSQYSNLDAIHIVSHGTEGQLYLGDTVLNAASMQGEHLDELTSIRSALSADGDILIYGCNFTGGDAGLEAAILLGSITGADIAASTDATGSSELGGDWDLETAVGAVETETIEAAQWQGLLAGSSLFQVGSFRSSFPVMR